jgi:hypothetical protein
MERSTVLSHPLQSVIPGMKWRHGAGKEQVIKKKHFPTLKLK